MANFKLIQTGEQIQADLDLLDKNTAIQGQVLTANGAGGASWQNTSGGTEVVANPTLAGTEAELTGLSVDGTKYKVPAAGTVVVANPTGSATAELSKLQVDGSVYSIPKSVPYTLPVASSTALGGIKVGDGLSIDSDGVLSADEQTPATPNNMVTTDTDQEISGVKTFTGEIDATSAAVTLPGGNTWLNGELNIGTSVASQGTVLFPTPGAGNTVTLATTNDISAAVGAIQTNTFTVTENADGTVDLTIE